MRHRLGRVAQSSTIAAIVGDRRLGMVARRDAPRERLSVEVARHPLTPQHERAYFFRVSSDLSRLTSARALSLEAVRPGWSGAHAPSV